MTLRSGLLVVATLLVLTVAIAAMRGATTGIALVWLVPVAIGLAIERRRYGSASSGAKPGAGWQATDERFVDDASGRLVEVWFQPATGARRYVEVDGQA